MKKSINGFIFGCDNVFNAYTSLLKLFIFSFELNNFLITTGIKVFTVNPFKAVTEGV